MMDLRKELGKSRVEQGRREQSPSDDISQHDAKRNARWNATRRALASGRKPPEKRFLVILNPKGPISDAEQLQKLLELPETPESIESLLVSNWEYGHVELGDIQRRAVATYRVAGYHVVGRDGGMPGSYRVDLFPLGGPKGAPF